MSVKKIALLFVLLFSLFSAIPDAHSTPLFFGATAGMTAGNPATYFASFMGSLPAGWTFARTGPAWRINSSGLLEQIATGLPRFDYDPQFLTLNGMYRENASTNNLLYSRDLTQVVWVKSNATAALTQTGIDGVANSASLVTATANNATVQQVVTLVSSTVTGSIWLKRVTGIGAISISQDGGSTYTDFFPAQNQYLRFSVAPQTLTNPTFIIKIATSGDAVAVDCAQEEVGRETSTIPTAATTVTRNAELLDYLTLSNMGFNAASGSFVFEGMGEKANYGGNQYGLVTFTNSTDSNVIETYFNTDNNAHGQLKNPTSFFGNGFGGLPSGGYKVFRIGMVYQNGNNVVSYAAGNSGTVVNDTASTFTTANVPAAGNITEVSIGGQRTGTAMQGWVRSFSYWNTPLSVSLLNQKTSLSQPVSSCVQPANFQTLALNKCLALQPSAPDCYNTIVTQSTNGYQAPITITTGGTYSGYYVTSSSSTPAITISTTAPVIIQHGGVAGPGGNLIATTVANATVTVNDMSGFSTSPTSWPNFIGFANGAINATITNNRMADTSGTLIGGASAPASLVTFDKNLGYNMNGGGAVHFLLMGNTGNTANDFHGSSITNSVVINEPFFSNSNDAFNFYNVAGTSGSPVSVTGNTVIGIYAPNPLTTGDSGCGYIADNYTTYVNFGNDTSIDTTNGGFCVDTPVTHTTWTNNLAVSSGVINGTSPVTGQNVGMTSSGDATNVFTGNRSYWMRAINTPITVAQVLNDYNFPNCASCFNSNLSLENSLTNANFLTSAIALEQQTIGPQTTCY